MTKTHEADLGRLVYQIEWEQAPFLKDFPIQIELPSFLQQNASSILQLSIDNAIPFRQAFKWWKRVNHDLLTQARIDFGQLGFREFIHTFSEAQNRINADELYLALAAERVWERKGKRIRPEYGIEHYLDRNCNWHITEPVKGSITRNPQRLLRRKFDSEVERLGITMHSHPIPMPHSIPEDVVELVSYTNLYYGAEYEKPQPQLAAEMTIDPKNFWVALRSRKTPNYDELDLAYHVSGWEDFQEEPVEKLLEFAKEFNLAIYKGTVSNLTTAQRVAV